MLASPCFLAGCSNKTTDEQLDDVSEEASETAETITMFMITEEHVPTKEELDALKANKGETSPEYEQALKKKEAYDNVAKALDDITKAKFRTHLITTFYTIDEYKKVEEMMEYQTTSAQMKEKAKTALRNYTREKKQQGIEDTAVIQSMFYAEHPEYAPYTDSVTVAPDSTTAAETVTDKYGNEQIKYPNAKPNQVDIVCVCGYNNYVKYVQNGWLKAIDGEIEGKSNAILTYVNEKFMKSAMIKGATYAIPNNTTIGEYTYLIIDKEKFDHYEYDYESIPAGSEALSSESFLEFLKDIQRYDKNYVPLTGDLELTNELFWTLNYKYESIGTFDDVAELSSDTLYFSKAPDGTHRLLTPTPDPEYTYATVTATAFSGTEFKKGTNYYTKGSDGYYELAKEYKEGEKYYTLKFTNVAVKEDQPFETFEQNKIYFQKVSTSSVSYIPVYTFDKNTEYFVVSEAEFDYGKFNIFGTVLNLEATLGTFVSPHLIKSNLYKNQIITLQKIKENGYYDKTAITYDAEKGEYIKNKDFASAIIKGDASLKDTYGDNYYMIVLEYPNANAEELCSNLIGISSSCKNVTRAMQVLTYITTNPEFRNILQYGIEGDNYVLENKVDPETGVSYKAVKRLNNYYSMDINKTGNLFIAYPEEYMSYNIWNYGKQQNSNAVYNPMLEFNLSEHISKIDFSKMDYFNAISAKYEEKINACLTSEELEAVLNEMSNELSADPYYQRETVHGASMFYDGVSVDPSRYNKYSIYNYYMHWWGNSDYFVIEE